MKTTTFTSIEVAQLAVVSGGAKRVAAGSRNDLDQQLQMMLMQISESIKEVASAKNNGGDMMMPLMMMMMMGGGGGGGASAAPPPPPPPPQPTPTYVRVNVRR